MNNKPIVILDLRDSPWVDGPGRTILDCAESLESNEFHFIIGSFSGGKQKTNEYADEAKRRGLELITINENSAFDISVLHQIRKIVSKNNVDIIHCHDFRSNLFGLLCAKMSKTAIITTAHGWIENDVKGKIYTIVDKILLRYFSHIIAVSNRTSTLIKKYFIADNKITVVSNALRIENYNAENIIGNLRDELGIDSNTILIGNVGRLSPEKGQIEFLQACNNILSENKNIKLVVVGVGPDKDALFDYVKSNNLVDFVYFLGFRTDMLNIYKNLNLIIQSSYTEGMPNVVLESMLMEVPVIATDVGGTSEIIEDNKTGVLITPGNIKEIEDKIKDFIFDKNKYLKMAKDGKLKIINKFSHDSRIKKIAVIYNNCVKGKC